VYLVTRASVLANLKFIDKKSLQLGKAFQKERRLNPKYQDRTILQSQLPFTLLMPLRSIDDR